MLNGMKDKLFLKFAGPALALHLTTACTTTPPVAPQTFHHTMSDNCLITTETGDGQIIPTFDEKCGDHIRKKSRQEIETTHRELLKIEQTAANAARWNAVAAAIQSGGAPLVKNLEERLLLAVVRQDPEGTAVLEKYKIDKTQLAKRVLQRNVKDTIESLHAKGDKPVYAAQANLLALYDGKREEFAGLEDLARETIDEALQKRGLDIENIRAAHELESRKVGHTPYHCGKSENGKGVVICAPLFTPQTIEY